MTAKPMTQKLLSGIWDATKNAKQTHDAEGWGKQLSDKGHLRVGSNALIMHDYVFWCDNMWKPSSAQADFAVNQPRMP